MEAAPPLVVPSVVPAITAVAPVDALAASAPSLIDPTNDDEKRQKRLARFGPAIIPPPRHKGPAVPERKEVIKQAEETAEKRGGDKKAEARKAAAAALCTAEELSAREARWGKVAPVLIASWLNTPQELELLAVKYKEARRDVPASITIRPDTLHVYGTDGVDAAPFAAHFAAFGAVQLEWLDDSCCNVKFSTLQAAEAAKNALSLPPKDVTGVTPHPNPWRLGSKCVDNILLIRHATSAKCDRKQRAPMSQALGVQLKIAKPPKKERGGKRGKGRESSDGNTIIPAIQPIPAPVQEVDKTPEVQELK